MRNIVVIIVTITVCVLLAFWSPWLYLNISINRIFGVEEPDIISGLYVYSLSGTLEVRVDGETVGSVTPDDSPLIIDRVEPGERLISVKRKSLLNDSYWTLNEVVTFVENTNVVISYNIGPTEEFSEGNIVHTEERKNEEINELTVNVNTDKATVALDDVPIQDINETTFKAPISLETQHQITVSKPNFETFTFTILPDTNEDREKLKDFNIVVDVRLLQIPIRIEEV